MSKIANITFILVCLLAVLKLLSDIRYNFESIKEMQAIQSVSLQQIISLQKGCLK